MKRERRKGKQWPSDDSHPPKAQDIPRKFSFLSSTTLFSVSSTTLTAQSSAYASQLWRLEWMEQFGGRTANTCPCMHHTALLSSPFVDDKSLTCALYTLFSRNSTHLCYVFTNKAYSLCALPMIHLKTALKVYTSIFCINDEHLRKCPHNVDISGKCRHIYLQLLFISLLKIN